MPSVLKDFCAIDFETACHNQASACSVALVKVIGGDIKETFVTFIRPPDDLPIIPAFTAIHHITKEMVAEAPRFSEAWPEMKAFVGDLRLVAHNASFDRTVLQKCLAFYGIEDNVGTFICTVELARKTWPKLPNHKLNTVCDHLGLELDHHEALSDALGCARIMIAVASQNKETA